jgi:hypothetical protein
MPIIGVDLECSQNNYSGKVCLIQITAKMEGKFQTFLIDGKLG